LAVVNKWLSAEVQRVTAISNNVGAYIYAIRIRKLLQALTVTAGETAHPLRGGTYESQEKNQDQDKSIRDRRSVHRKVKGIRQVYSNRPEGQ